LRIRIDFGRVLVGILLVVLALALLVVLGVVALVAYLFSFIPLWAGVLHVAVELTLFPAVLLAVGVAAVLAGVSWWGPRGRGWASGVGAARARQDKIKVSGRVGEVIGFLIAAVVLLFLYQNQLRGIAFYAPTFGAVAKFFFYGPLVTGMALSLARAGYGRRNPIRPFDALNSLFLAVSAFWLLSAFPFDFTHFADMFPTAIQFIFGWLNNEIGRVLLFLAGFAAVINFAYTAILYSVVRGHLLRGGA
jgi:hypothetical protein